MFSNFNDANTGLDPDEVSQFCFDQFKKLSKNGKPMSCEWTVLSCILTYNKVNNKLQMISLGTGTKCIGEAAMSPMGVVLNDGHAEVMARRGFLLYVYESIENTLASKPSILTQCEDGKFKLNDNFDLIFYSTHVPCGDATIAPNNDEKSTTLKHKLDDTNQDVPSKKPKLENDIQRTGAKCLPNSDVQDPQEPGDKFHIYGQVRTKPGRGVRTLSVSCTDKIAKWIHLGIQGSLITLFCKPFYIKYFVFGTGNAYNEESLKRAFLNRNGSNIDRSVNPVFYQSKLEFEYLKSDIRHRPSPNSKFWINLKPEISEVVSAHGKKLGVTKNQKPINMAVSICKYNIYKRFIELLITREELRKKIVKDMDPKSIPYNEMKKKAMEYYEHWKIVKETFFKSWTVKPDMWDFCVD